MANLFQAAGLKPGDHVALCLENRMEFYPSVGAPTMQVYITQQ